MTSFTLGHVNTAGIELEGDMRRMVVGKGQRIMWSIMS